MGTLVNSLALNSADELDVFFLCAIFTFVAVTILWAAGLFLGNHSIMDAWYGWAYVAPAILAYLISGAESATATLLLFMVMLHGGRLGWYLFARWRRYVSAGGGDKRYVGLANQSGYWWKSLFTVMEPQAAIIVLIGSPVVVGIVANRAPAGEPTPLTFVGLLVFTVGLYFETVADAQLQSFLELKQRPRYMNTGVWKHSRHPNYFGTTTVWWGMWLVAVAGAPGTWWTVIGPIINTIMLTSVLGSKFQDRVMGKRPAYRELMAHTRPFLPIPLSASTIARNNAWLAREALRDDSQPNPAMTSSNDVVADGLK